MLKSREIVNLPIKLVAFCLIYNSLNIKIAVINQSIKQLKSNYYDSRSKKVENLISNLDKNDFKNSTLGGCIFYKKGEYLCLKPEKR